MRVIGTQHERNEQIEALRTLIERLSAPDLTLTEAKVLRGQLANLLEPCDGPAGGDRTGSSPGLIPSYKIGDSRRHNLWSPETSIWTAG